MLARLAHFIEHHPRLHRFALAIWRHFPPRVAGFLKGTLATSRTVGAVAVLVDDQVNPPEVLLVEHSYRTRGVWGLPGGALEASLGNPLAPRDESSPDDVLESTLKREIQEELGIDIDVLQMMRVEAVPYVPEEPGPYRLDLFFRCAPSIGFPKLRKALAAGTVKPRSPELKQIRLVALDHAADYDLYSTDAKFLQRDFPRLSPLSTRSARSA